MTAPTKIEAGFNTLNRIQDLDDMAAVLFPGNPRHQHAFAVIFFVLKWSDGAVADLCRCVLAHGVSQRVFERTRAKMRRLGLIDHVSRFNKKHGYREGWVLSTRFCKSLEHLAAQIGVAMTAKVGKQREKDRFAIELLWPAGVDDRPGES
ncbi:hypothetical protein ACFL6C_11075 [Myxococcota bacterium]